MTRINKLNEIDEISAGDLLVIFVNSDGLARKASVSTLQDFMQENLSFGVSGFTTQYDSPVTGASIQITDGQSDIHLITTPLGTLADLDIILPANPVDEQLVLVNCTQIITALTIDGGSNAVIGAPTSLAANDFFTLKHDAPTNVWYRVG